MSVTIRPARLADAAGMYRAWQALRQYNAGRDPRIVPTPVSEEEFVVAVREILARSTSAAFVAENGGKVVGFVSVSVEAGQPDRLPERHATIGYVYVDSAHRRGGVGRQLFEAVAGWASKQDGVSHMEMAVIAGDTEAAAFWQSIGFTPFIQRLWAPLDGAGRP